MANQIKTFDPVGNSAEEISSKDENRFQLGKLGTKRIQQSVPVLLMKLLWRRIKEEKKEEEICRFLNT